MREIKTFDIEKDLKQFEELSITSFGSSSNENPDFIKWVFYDNPYNPPSVDNMMYVLKDDGKIIASDGLSPLELYYRGSILKAAHSIKSMTHPDFKRQGIFKTMTENSISEAEKHGFDIVIGLANENSFPAYKKFGWDIIFQRETYIYPVNIANKLNKMLKISLLSNFGNSVYKALASHKIKKNSSLKKNNFFVQTCNYIAEDIVNEIWNKYKNSYDICIARDGKYIDYRYNKRPDVEYVYQILYDKDIPCGFSIMHVTVANGKKMVSLVEFFTDPQNENYISALAESFINYSFSNNIEYIVACTGLHGKYSDILHRFGFIKLKAENTIMVTMPFTEKATDLCSHGHDSWHITQGDGESDWDLV